MKPLHKSWLYFNYSEKRITFVYLVLCIIAVTYIKILQYTPFSGIELSQTQINKFEKLIAKQEQDKDQIKSLKSTSYHFVSMFDPNKISKEELILSGLKPKIADRILNYRKYYPIKNCNQMFAIYGIDSLWVTQAKEYMVFNTSNYQKRSPRKHNNHHLRSNHNPSTSEYNTAFERSEAPKVILNTATEQQLQALYGIGPTRAKRIVQYRNKLGGFTSINQLTEVYGIDSAWVKQNHKKLHITEDIKKTIPVNTDSFKLLIQHPYIDYSTAKLIVNFRKQHGNYRQTEDLYKNYGLDSALILKVKPYLFFE